jgi:4-amino-4-deoxy-L-arabinose transferase-like glycosyltransferase
VRRRLALTPSVVALSLLVFATLWLGVLGFTSLSAPSDNIEQLTWVRSLEWGYFKHPPLPTWLLWLPVQMFGLSVWVSYLMGAVMTLGALAIMWRLLRTMRGSAFADIALMAGLCLTYYNRRLFYYNHNVVLLLLSVASAALLWQAYTSRRLRWWMALGVAIGLGALTKYQIAVTVVSVLAFMVHQRAWRDPAHRAGLLSACLTALVILVPHVEWLRGHDFGPIGYAVESSLGVGLSAPARVQNTLLWLVDQLLAHGTPAFALLGVAAWQLRRLGPVERASPTTDDAPFRDPARALIFAWGIVPLCLMPFIGIFLGAELKGHWGTAFLIFAVPALMELAPRGFWDRVDLRRLLPVFLVIQGALLILECVISRDAPVAYSRHGRKYFDSAAYANLIADSARAQLGGPIRVVSGPLHPASILGIQLAEKPLVFIDARRDRSPWISAGLVDRCGAVELGYAEAIDLAKADSGQHQPRTEFGADVRIDPAGAHPVGPMFPGLSWRVRLPKSGASPCELT